MTISAGGYNFDNRNLSQTPTRFEQQTSGQQSLQNQAEIGRGNVVIVPQSEQDLVPFTKLQERNTWQYKSETGHPTLLPMGTLRGGSPELEAKDRSAAFYTELFDQLPEEVKEELGGLATVYTEAFKQALRMAAKALAWQEKAEIQISSEGAYEYSQASQNYSKEALRASQDLAKEFTESANRQLEDLLGSNHPGYLEAKEGLHELKQLVDEVVHD